QVAQLTIGSNILTLNGAKITMDTKAKVVNGRTVLPLRAVATALGANVAWNEADQTVTVK
ncbi:copper amine oxidase N-terminal domain-containing protein, partial [Schinkia azotoformans]